MAHPSPPRSRLRGLLHRWFVLVGVVVTLLLVLGGLAAAWAGLREPRLPERLVLELRLERELGAGPGGADPLAKALAGNVLPLPEVLAALERAASDERVAGVFAHLGGGDYGMASAQELRDAILRLRARGKFAVAFSETFGEVGPGNQGYYVATAFDEIWLQPSGDVGLTGLIASSPFVRGTFELLGAEFRGDHRKEYKNALNFYQERRYTPAHREALQAILEDGFTDIVAAIAERSGLAREAVRALVDGGPFLGREALDAKLVDRLGYRDEVVARVKERGGEGAELLYAERYLERAGSPWKEGTRVAVIYGTGAVTRGSGGFDPISGSGAMGSDTVGGALRAAAAADDVKAILFRVDSPGGSYVASDAIWREVMRAREAGKKVVVSMGNVAGSGGYFVAMAADKIVAQPATITGSIGVLGGKMILRDTWNRVGVTWDSVQTSSNAAIWSETHDYGATEWARFQAWLDRVYADFTAKVAQGRRLEPDAVEKVAKGRIWSGKRAKELGLVDELGGFLRALEVIRTELGLEADAPLHLVTFPEPKGLLAQVLDDGPDNGEPARAATGLDARSLEQLRALARDAQVALGPDDVLAMPVVRVGR